MASPRVAVSAMNLILFMCCLLWLKGCVGLKLKEFGLRGGCERVHGFPASCVGVENVFYVPLQIAWGS
jgi:hypothetical protein